MGRNFDAVITLSLLTLGAAFASAQTARHYTTEAAEEEQKAEEEPEPAEAPEEPAPQPAAQPKTGGARADRSSGGSAATPAPAANAGCPPNWSGHPWANYTRRADQTRFTHLRRHGIGQGTAAEFPNFGGNNTLEASANEYVSLEFSAVARHDGNGPTNNNVPDGVLDLNDFYGRDNLRHMIWAESQGGYQAELTGVYLSISKCPGDFRVPTSYTAPANDPTLSFACRNLRPRGRYDLPSAGPIQFTGALAYDVNRPSSDLGCGLEYGKTYYLNFMVVNPLDGYQFNERNCKFVPGTNPPLTARCGIQLHARP